MRLVIFSELRGLWLEDSEGERNIGGGRSSVDIQVTDGSGFVLSGKLLIGGAPHTVKNGASKLLCEHFSKNSFTSVEFIYDCGIRLSCADIRPTLYGGWRFPAPSESVGDEDILRLLGRIGQLEAKLDAAKALCSETVSEVLGI